MQTFGYENGSYRVQRRERSSWVQKVSDLTKYGNIILEREITDSTEEGQRFMRKGVNVLSQKRRVNERTVDVPVVVDDVKSYRTFKMTRCTYLTIDAIRPARVACSHQGPKR